MKLRLIITRRNYWKPASSAGKLSEQITIGIAFTCDWLRNLSQSPIVAMRKSRDSEKLLLLPSVENNLVCLFFSWFLYSKRSTPRQPSIEWKTFSSVLDQRNRRSRTTMEIYLNQLAWQRIRIFADIKSLCNSRVEFLKVTLLGSLRTDYFSSK